MLATNSFLLNEANPAKTPVLRDALSKEIMLELSATKIETRAVNITLNCFLFSRIE